MTAAERHLLVTVANILRANLVAPPDAETRAHDLHELSLAVGPLLSSEIARGRLLRPLDELKQKGKIDR